MSAARGLLSCRGVALITILAKLGAAVFVAYKVTTRGRVTLGGTTTFVAAIIGVMACFDGVTLAYREENRARYGRVTSGVILERFSSTEAQGSRYIGRRGGHDQARRRPIVTITGFQVHDVLARESRPLTGGMGCRVRSRRRAKRRSVASSCPGAVDASPCGTAGECAAGPG